MTTTLTQTLANYKAAFIARVDPARVAMMEAATDKLRASGIERSALQVGDKAPDLTLPDANGKPVRLQNLWSKGPLVVIFYRGAWCPYCNLELRAWQHHLTALKERGGSLVAISPQTPDNSLSTIEKNELAFPVLSDSSLIVSSAFGVAFELPPELIDLYGKVGNDLPSLNGNGRWVLPVPATYVIDQNGQIAWSHIDSDYRTRAEPIEVLHALDHIN